MSDKVYVINEDKFVYEINIKDHGNEFEKLITLNLAYGWDYISEESDQKGFVSADNFIDEFQYESYICYVLHESVLDRLKEEGFKLVDLSKLQLESIIHAI